MRNYDTTVHKPYPRISEVLLRYSPEGVPFIEYVELMAIVDGDGKVQHLSNTPNRFVLDLSKITEPVQVVNPSTGLPIPEMTMTSQQLMLGLLAFLRADQIRRDMEAG